MINDDNKPKKIVLVFGPRDKITYSEVLNYIEHCEGAEATTVKSMLMDYVNKHIPKHKKRRHSRTETPDRRKPKTKKITTQAVLEEPIIEAPEPLVVNDLIIDSPQSDYVHKDQESENSNSSNAHNVVLDILGK